MLILKEGSAREKGKGAQHNNIMAAKVVAEAVRSALGPKGMDKMLVDSFGDVTITSDGRTILDEMDIQHPAAKMMVEVAKTQDDEVGDGTTSAVIIAGALLAKAEDLIDKKVHPTVIIDGYRGVVIIAQPNGHRTAPMLDGVEARLDHGDACGLDMGLRHSQGRAQGFHGFCCHELHVRHHR